MRFFVKIQEKYYSYKFRQLNEASEKVLNSLVEIIPVDKLVKKFKEPDYELLADKHLTECTVDHFKGLSNIIIQARHVGNSSILDLNGNLHD